MRFDRDCPEVCGRIVALLGNPVWRLSQRSCSAAWRIGRPIGASVWTMPVPHLGIARFAGEHSSPKLRTAGTRERGPAEPCKVAARSDQGSELFRESGASLFIAGGRGHKAHTQELSGGPCIGTGIKNGGSTPGCIGDSRQGGRRVVQADIGSVARLVLAQAPIETESRRAKWPFSPDASCPRRGRRRRRHYSRPKSVVGLGQWSRRPYRTAVPWGGPSVCRYRCLGSRRRHHSSQNLS